MHRDLELRQWLKIILLFFLLRFFISIFVMNCIVWWKIFILLLFSCSGWLVISWMIWNCIHISCPKLYLDSKLDGLINFQINRQNIEVNIYSGLWKIWFEFRFSMQLLMAGVDFSAWFYCCCRFWKFLNPPPFHLFICLMFWCGYEDTRWKRVNMPFCYTTE